VAEFAYEPGDEAGPAPGESVQEVSGKSPWRLAGRRLVRNRLALAALTLFVLIVVVSVGAPVYAHHIAHTHPFDTNLEATTVIGEIPIGPTWHANYFIGADEQGRDVMARVLYGGRSSLEIGVGSALLCSGIASVLALLAGFFGRLVDAVLSRLMDLIWAFPVYLLAISLATVLLTLEHPFVDPASLWIPTIIIAFVYVPYVYRPVRGQVLSVREKEFVEAAVGLGASNVRLMFGEILPNVLPTVIVMLPLMIATTVLTEAALSFLGIGVQDPTPSWGTIIQDGQGLLYERPLVAIVPGIMIVLTVLSLNVFGDGLRDALDPRSKVR